jgi:hypothetical protein
LGAFGVCVLLVFVLLRPHEFMPALRSLSPLNLATLVTLAGLCTDWVWGRLKSFHVAQGSLYALYVLWTVVSLVATVGVGTLAQSGPTLVFPALYFAFVAYAFRTLPRYRAAMLTLMGIMLFIACVCVVQARGPWECVLLDEESRGELTGRGCEHYRECVLKGTASSRWLCEKVGPLGSFSTDGRVRWIGVLADPNELCMVLAASMTFVFAMRAPRKTPTWLLASVVGPFLACVFASGSRGGMLTFIVVFAVYFVRAYGARGLVTGAAAALPLLLFGGRSGGEESTMERVETLHEGFLFFKAHPLFGLGHNQFVENWFITAHNSYLLAAAELGYLGLVLFLGLLVHSTKIPWAIARSRSPYHTPELRAYGLALGVSWLGNLVSMFFLSMNYHPVVHVFFGLSAALHAIANRQDPRFKVRMGAAAWIGVALAAAVILAFIGVYATLKVSR